MTVEWTRNGTGDRDPQDLAARARQAERRARMMLASAATDLTLDDADRLDERLRIAVITYFRSAIGAVEAAIRRHTLRLLADHMTAVRAESLLLPAEAVPARMTRAGLLRDPDLLEELLARLRQDRLAAALPVAPGAPDEPSLLVRLSLAPDAPVARAAAALLAAESRRRDQFERAAPDGADLSAELYGWLTWRVAAAMRGETDDALRDRALAEAALRCIGAHGEGERADALAVRLAAAIDPRPAEIASLLVEAIGDRRPGFFAAVMAHTLGLSFEQARAILLEPDGERLWLALRGLNLDRAAIARIGLALGEGDPARDVEAFAEALDAIAAVPQDDALAALEPLTLPVHFRSAVRVFEGGMG